MKIQPSEMVEAADAACDLLKALANRHRLMIICQLFGGERSVGDLADLLGIRQAAVSQHLALLRKDGLVATRRDGQTIYYRIGSEPARAMVEALYQCYCVPGRAGPSDEPATAPRHQTGKES